MTTWFLDTDVVIDLLRGHPPAVEWHGRLSGDDRILLSGITLAELVEGCTSKADFQAIEHLLGLPAEWPTEEDCRRAFDMFASLRLRMSIQWNDCVIAAIAMRLGLPIQSFNVSHYGAIDGLRLGTPYVRVLQARVAPDPREAAMARARRALPGLDAGMRRQLVEELDSEREQ